MKSKKYCSGLLILFCACMLLVAPRAYSDIEWSVKTQLKLDASPADIALSADGKWIYVLASGEILVYSVPEYKEVKRIPVDKSFDRMVYSSADNALVLSSSAEKSLKVIQLEVLHHFSVEGLPFEGQKNAPVTIMVFSDYQ
jgi:protein-disulfide isomerase